MKVQRAESKKCGLRWGVRPSVSSSLLHAGQREGAGQHEYSDWPDLSALLLLQSRSCPFHHDRYRIALKPWVRPGIFCSGYDHKKSSLKSLSQALFVKADLASVDRSRTPWVVVAMHRMMVAPVSRSPNNLYNLERLSSDFSKLFYDHGVDVVIQVRGGQRWAIF